MFADAYFAPATGFGNFKQFTKYAHVLPLFFKKTINIIYILNQLKSVIGLITK